MKTVLIGHRGTGKTSLLQRYQIYFSLRKAQVSVFDLDREIEKGESKSISEIFADKGEEYFRELEVKYFNQVAERSSDFVISLGAGFPLEKLPKHFEKIWLRRSSDKWPRVFFDRPLSNREDYLSRFEIREKSYRQHCDWIYEIPEGLNFPNEVEKKILFNEVKGIGGILTLTPFHLERWESFSKRELTWGFDAFEIRDDLLTSQQIDLCLESISQKQILFSFRTADSKYLDLLKQEGRTDWALEKGEPPSQPTIISLHQRAPGETLADSLSRFEGHKGIHQKLAVEIRNFAELQEGLRWQQHLPFKRSFLPRLQGQWTWARLWLKARQQLNFIRASDLYPDQPSLFEYLASPALPQQFAAVLGDPVEHSYSPTEHLLFASERGLPFFRIQIPKEEWAWAWTLLNHLGLKFAAVTSPLKTLARESAEKLTGFAAQFQSVNTLIRTRDGDWLGENTDIDGFRSQVATLQEPGEILVWGGGGTSPVIAEVFPEAVHYSSRTAQPREGKAASAPSTVIWAASPQAAFPPSTFRPKYVVDLNYRMDSQARDYAKSVGADYLSGLTMFKMQALSQQDFWEKHL